MVDGVSGTDLYRVILDDSPQPRAAEDGWRPVPGPSGWWLTALAVRDLALNPPAQA